MAAVLPPWPHAATATQTCVRIGGDEPMRLTLKRSRKHPCSVSVRLHGDLILSHGLRRIDGWYVVMATDPVVRALDHRVVVPDPAVLRSAETWSEFIHKMLAVAPVTAEYDLAADNWLDSISSPAYTPRGIAMAIVSHFGEQIDGLVDTGRVVPGIDIDIYLPGLWVTLLYSEPKALLLACKEAAAKTEAAGAMAPGRKLCRESSEPCAICLDSRDEETVTLPCSHAFHTGCIGTWFHRASTCPTCRRDIMECFSFVRWDYTHEVAEDEPWLYLYHSYVQVFRDDIAEAMSQGYSDGADELMDTIDFSDPELLEGEEYTHLEAENGQLM